MELRGADIVIEALIEQGIDRVFGYPGGTVIDLYDALYKYSDKITHVITSHEQGAVHAADGYARATGKVGVVIATSGPGATNLVTGIATAYADSSPIIAITGNVPLSLIGRDSFQEVDTTGITMPITKHNYIVKDIKSLADTIRSAFQVAKSGRPGPVLVDIPKNIQIGTCDFENKEPYAKAEAQPADEEQIEAAVKLIEESKKPFVLAGGGAILANASNELMELVKRIDAPVGATVMGLTGIPHSYKGFTGMMGMHGDYASSWSVQEADLILAVGTRFSDRVTGNKSEFGKNAKILHIDIDNAEIGKNIEAYMYLTGDTKNILKALISKLPQIDNSKWTQEVMKIKNDNRIIERASSIVSPKKVIEALWDSFGDELQITTDVGQHQMWAAQYSKLRTPRTFITSGGLGTMGFGLGAAIGAYYGTGKKTALITGDGSFHMNMNEMATLVSYDLPIVVIVMNNGVLGMVKQWQSIFFDKRYSNTVLNRKTDFVKLAEAFGAAGFRITDNLEIDAVLREAFSLNKPVIIDCRIDMEEYVLPMIPPGATIKEMITEIQ